MLATVIKKPTIEYGITDDSANLHLQLSCPDSQSDHVFEALMGYNPQQPLPEAFRPGRTLEIGFRLMGDRRSGLQLVVTSYTPMTREARP